MPDARLHDLRHFVATQLIEAGHDIRTVSGRLGHAKTSTTLDIYAAFLRPQDRQRRTLSARCSATAIADQRAPAKVSSADDSGTVVEMLLRGQRRWSQLLPALTAVLLAGCSSDDTDRSATPATTSTSVAVDAHPTVPGPPAPSCEASEPEPRPGLDTTVRIVVFCGDPVGPPSYVIAGRVVPDDGEPLRAALQQLLAGVTPAEAEAGLASSFSSFNVGQLVDVDLSDGLATIEWTPGWVTTTNFSTSTVGGIVLDQVAGTAFQFENVEGIEFLVDGERWCGWETTCEGISSPRISRAEFAPPECVEAWQTGAVAPIRCEDLVAAYTITMAAEQGREDPPLLQAADIGPTFSEVEPDAVSGPCSLVVSGASHIASRSFVSNAAQQLIDVRVLTFEDAASAADAFAAARAVSSCEASEFGEAAGAPTSVQVEGADESFRADFADSNDASEVAVARRGEYIVALETTLHQGAATSDPVGAFQLTAAAIALLE